MQSRLIGTRIVRTVGEVSHPNSQYCNTITQQIKDVFDNVTSKETLIELINNETVNQYQLLKDIICNSIKYKNWEIFNYVITNGAIIDIVEYNDTQLLIHFILKNETKAVTKMLKMGADPNMNYPIGVACKMNNLMIVIELLKYNVNINDNDVYTHALQHVCVNGNDEIAELLIKSGADIKVTEDTYLYYAYCKMYEGNVNYEKIVKMLIKAGVNTNKQPKVNTQTNTNKHLECTHPEIRNIRKYTDDYRFGMFGPRPKVHKLHLNQKTVLCCELLLNGKLLNTIIRIGKSTFTVLDNVIELPNKDYNILSLYYFIFYVNSVHRNATFKKLIKYNIKCNANTLLRIYNTIINSVNENIDNTALMRTFKRFIGTYTKYNSCEDLCDLIDKIINKRDNYDRIVPLTQYDIKIIKILLIGAM